MCIQPIWIDKQQVWAPCRTCPECRLQRARVWGCRCYFELKKYDKACFITLTYDPEHNPIICEKKPFQDFMKRFRKAIAPLQVKYFACGEYGEIKKRPHYHAVIFGYDFPDKVQIGKSNKGYPIMISDQLSKLWKLGYHTIQEVTLATVIYSALYSAKARKALPEHLQAFPEFNLMSQSIGVDVIIKDLDHYMLTDQIYIDGKPHCIPDAVLKKAYVILDDSGRIVSKDDKYVDLKERRRAKYEANNKRLVDIQAKLIAAQKAHELGAKYEMDFEDLYRQILADKQYRADKKQPKKTL